MHRKCKVTKFYLLNGNLLSFFTTNWFKGCSNVSTTSNNIKNVVPEFKKWAGLEIFFKLLQTNVIGAGAGTKSITAIFSGNIVQSTNTLDMAISGKGFSQ